MKEATWVPNLDLGNAKRAMLILREGLSQKNDKEDDEDINSTWRGRVSRTKHEQNWDH